MTRLAPLLRAAWHYRQFVRSAIAGEFRARLSRSALGTAWIVLQPLAQVVVFATVLSSVMAARIQGIESSYGYVVYLLSGIACWNLFSEVVSRCLTVFVDHAHLLRKMHFPRITLPLVVMGSALVSNLAFVGLILLSLPLLGFDPSPAWLWAPVLIALTVAFAAGLGLLLGTLNVFSRDVGQVTSVILQFWFWMTPITYPASIVPAHLRATLQYNPLAPLVASYQNVFVRGNGPTADLWFTVAMAFVMLVLALTAFRRASSELVDAL